MGYAEVVVNSPVSRGATSFHYSLPDGLSVQVGQLVWVPFGQQCLQGVVLDLPETVAIDLVRDVAGVVDPQPVLSSVQIQLARWIARHYCCPLLDAVRLMLPPGIEQHTHTFLELASGAAIGEDLSPREQAVVHLLGRYGRLRADRLPRFGVGLASVARELVQRGLVLRTTELERARVHPKLERRVVLTPQGADRAAAEALPARCRQQRALLSYLQVHPQDSLSPSELLAAVGAGPSSLRGLLTKGLVSLEEHEVWRDPLAQPVFPPQAGPPLTPEQQVAWQTIQASLGQAEPKVFLLQGVTGSGKTELYLRALDDVLRRGQGAIVLVPEIALTPQTVHRFAARFPGRIAVQHSQLSAGERYDQWRRIRDGRADVVIGPRSAIFAPLRNLGLVVLDEEHEWTYKQDRSPNYHARDVALKLAELTGAKVILGSATPDLVSYHRAQRGEYQLLRLRERVLGGAMPPVHIVDMRQELKSGNRSIFSRALAGALAETLAAGEQSILFINRRGASTFIMCRDCGHVLRCRRCDVPLVFHTVPEETLLCHQCNLRAKLVDSCPNCLSPRIKFFGVGTQRVEAEVRRVFPQARVLRWDRDVTQRKAAHEQLLEQFVSHQADVLVGTQMIAKGLDLPLVTLVGVVAADTSLHLPDFRAAERTFQLLAQVAGRAGRRELPGRVIVQTYSPEHYSIQAASLHDYGYFYQREIAFRREHDYPPFGALAKLLYASTSDKRSQFETDRLARVLRRQVELLGLPATDVLGPAPSYWRKLRGRYRWQIILRGAKVDELLQSVDIPPHWTVDVDPVSLL